MFRFLFFLFLLSVLPAFAALELSTGRKAFIHNEKDAVLRLYLKNNGDTTISNIQLSGSFNGQTINLQDAGKTIPPRGNITMDIPMETRLKVGKYPSTLQISYRIGKERKNSTFTFDLFIGPALHDYMPVIMSKFETIGAYGFRDIQNLGFTHASKWQYSGSFLHQPEIIDLLVEKYCQELDEMITIGFRAQLAFTIQTMWGYPKHHRITRTGRELKGVIDASQPGTVKEAGIFAQKVIKTYADYSAFDIADFDSEIRDTTQPSFSAYNIEAFEKYAGFKIPQEVDQKTGPHYSSLKDFPESRVIPDRFPLLVYYRWFWKQGDGWNPLHTMLNDLFKGNMKVPLKTFFEPAIRVPPLWGSGGNVDSINTWTYPYPHPLMVGANASELQAMADEIPGREYRVDIQIISYRSATAPVGQKVANEPAWVKEKPHAPYITLAPDLMREAVWLQLSRKMCGISFHGYNSLLIEPLGQKHGYQCTNLKTKDALSELLLNVVRPLGPVIKRVAERPPEVAILESFTSAIFADRCTWGSRGWIIDCNLMLQWANMMPAVIYEEKILRDGFGNIKVLVMPYCEVLSEPVYKAILEFQKKGGIIAADKTCVPGIVPDILINIMNPSGNVVTDKTALQKNGRILRQQLEPYFKPYTDCSNPDLVSWIRSDAEADYLFIVNDKRTFGDYWGVYGLVQEKGLPNAGVVTIRRLTGAVYDLVKHGPIPFKSENGVTAIQTDFATNDGRMYLLLPRPIGSISLSVPKKTVKGKEFTIVVKVKDINGKDLENIMPVQITVTDSNGEKTDDSCFGATQNGSYRQKITVPLNAKAGIWKITAAELASGKMATCSIDIKMFQDCRNYRNRPKGCQLLYNTQRIRGFQHERYEFSVGKLIWHIKRNGSILIFSHI